MKFIHSYLKFLIIFFLEKKEILASEIIFWQAPITELYIGVRSAAEHDKSNN